MFRACPTAAAIANNSGLTDGEAEIEEEKEEVDLAAPHDSLTVHENTKSKDLDTLLNQIKKGSINLEPRYQRKYIWPKDKACRLVESVIASLFVPALVLHTNAEGVHDVVDGKQRLTTLRYFWEGHWPDDPKAEFRLQGLNLLKELNGKTYHDLSDRADAFPSKRHFDEYSLTVTTFFQTTSQEAVLRVYEDLNCGAESLNKQQIRRAVYGGPYIDLLDKLCKNSRFQALLNREGKGMDTSEKDQN
ncbi:hypothetical protein N2152v2_006625 [Parachlorella kessleri]